MEKKFEATVRTQECEKIMLSLFEEDLWMSVWGIRSHMSIQLNHDSPCFVFLLKSSALPRRVNPRHGGSFFGKPVVKSSS
mgnify:CR=1 FL=1